MNAVHRMIQLIACLALLASLALAPQGVVRADPVIRYVATGGSDTSNDCTVLASPCLTIQYAIDQANADGDTIEVGIGTYISTETQVVLVDRNLTLSGGWDADFLSQTGVSTISGQGSRRGITVNSSMTAALDHFRIQNGKSASANGGGISNAGTLSVSYSTISAGAAAGFGGGIYNTGDLTLSHSVISSNLGKGGGGGIYNHGTLTISDSTIASNTAGQNGSSPDGGGGIQSSNAEGAVITNTTIRGNKVLFSYRGSGIQVSGGYGMTVNNSTISANTGDTALYAQGAAITLNNSTISGNSDPSGAGAIHAYNTNITLNNITVTKNTGTTTGGIYIGGSSASSIRNSILAGNTATGTNDWDGADCDGSITSAGYNLIGNNKGCTFSAATGDKVGTAAHPIAPKLGALLDNGGPTFTHALSAVSPAWNAGNPNLPGSGGNTCLATDQRGVDRVVENDCDIGAYEGIYLSVLSVTRTGADPTKAASVGFKVVFSSPVTGVDTVAPFPDFSLTTTGVKGASITKVSGSGADYTVTVKTGSGNGTIRVNVVDDDSIKDADLMPLGQPGEGNGNFTAGQVYTVTKSPSPVSPASTFWDLTPTYKWRAVPGATKYEIQLVKGTTTIYTRSAAATGCTTTCSLTPSTVLKPDNYKWKVRAAANGHWQAWTPYLPFKLVAPSSGLWSGGAVVFSVPPTQDKIQNFSFYVAVPGCGTYRVTRTAALTLKDGYFEFKGAFWGWGLLSSNYPNAIVAHGETGVTAYYIPGCGKVTSDTYAWVAYWQNADQPPDLGAGTAPIIVMPAPGADNALPVGPAEPR